MHPSALARGAKRAAALLQCAARPPFAPPAHAGLTEREKEEGAKAAQALKDQMGGSDDDADDYRQASKVRVVWGPRGR